MILGAFERPESQHSNDGKNGKFASEHGKLHANWKDICETKVVQHVYLMGSMCIFIVMSNTSLNK